MNRETEETQPAPAPWAIDLLILIAALAGFAVHMLLLVRHFTDASLGIAGCGEGSGCEEILTSRWSQIFHIPVPAIGMLVYLGLMFSLTPRGRRLLAPMLGLGLHAGLVPDSMQASFKASRLLFRFLRAYGKEAR